MIPYFFFMEVECIGNTQIIHMEETGITKQTIGLEATLKLKPFPHSYLYWKLHKCNISLICQRQERAATLQLYEVVEGFFLDSSFYAIQLKSLMPQKSCKEEVFLFLVLHIYIVYIAYTNFISLCMLFWFQFISDTKFKCTHLFWIEHRNEY